MVTGVHGVHMVTVTRNVVVAVSHDHVSVTTPNQLAKENNAKENPKVPKLVTYTIVQVSIVLSCVSFYWRKSQFAILILILHWHHKRRSHVHMLPFSVEI